MSDAAVLPSQQLPLADDSNRDELTGGTPRRKNFKGGGDHAPDLMNGDDMEPMEPALRFRPSCHLYPYDELTVFQSAPLVWRDEDNALHPIDMLDFDRERETLTDSIERSAKNFGCEISLIFETLTMDRLGEFLATSDTQVLHFSCHGSPGSLCVEDESGGTQRLEADGLRKIMSTRGEAVRFVFVSACFSRDAGQAFVDAGVPHVVCCQQDKPIMDVTAMEFTRMFYSALSSGRTLRESFELGKQAVEHSPLITHERSADEARKYVLLPEGADHNVPVFYTKPREHFTRSKSRSIGNLPCWVVPRPLVKIVGRELDLYRMIQSLKHQSLVKVTGPPGIGKRSAAKALCQYVLDRCLAFPFKEVVWLPLVHTSQQRTDELLKSLRTVWKLINEKGPCDGFCHGSENDYTRACGTIIDLLHQRKALFVINAVELQEAEAAEKLCIFLRDVFNGLGDLVKVVLVVPPGLEGSFSVDCEEAEISLRPLGFKETADLFGRRCSYVKEGRCPRVGTEAELSRLLVLDGQGEFEVGDERLSKRSADIFDLIGGGVPEQILTAAKQMTPETYDRLIRLGEREDPDAVYDTRFALDQALATLHEKIAKARDARKYQLAQRLKDEYDELESLKKTFPDLSELKELLRSTMERESRAASDQDFASAHDLKKKISQLKKQIKSEERAQSDFIFQQEVRRVHEQRIWEQARLMGSRPADQNAEAAADEKKDSQHAAALEPDEQFAAASAGSEIPPTAGVVNKDFFNAWLQGGAQHAPIAENLLQNDAEEALQSKSDTKREAKAVVVQTAEQSKEAKGGKTTGDAKPATGEMTDLALGSVPGDAKPGAAAASVPGGAIKLANRVQSDATSGSAGSAAASAACSCGTDPDTSDACGQGKVQQVLASKPAVESNGEQEAMRMDEDSVLVGDNVDMMADEKTNGEVAPLVQSDPKENLQRKGNPKPEATPAAMETVGQPKKAKDDGVTDVVKSALKESLTFKAAAPSKRTFIRGVRERRMSKRKPFSIVISQGSVLEFRPPNPSKSAIVNSTNEECVGKKGVDGAIAEAGGPNLERDRASLPVVARTKAGKEIRCPTGEAKVTGKDGASYGTLEVPFVIHAVGPRYKTVSSLKEGDRLLRKAYNESLERARELKLHTVAFSLISAGVYREPQSLHNVLRIGLKTIRNFSGYEELCEVHLFAFKSEQYDALVGIAGNLGLPKVNSKKQLCLRTSDISDDTA